MQSTVRLSSQNRIALPREVGAAMHLKGRDELQLVVKDRTAVIMPRPAGYQGALSGAGKGVHPKIPVKRGRGAW